MKRVNPRSLENLQPRYAPDRPGETATLGIRLRKDQRQKLDKLSTLRGVAIGVLIREAVDNYLSQLPGAVSEKATPSPPPDSPPLDAVNLAQVLTEVLTVPRLPVVAKTKLQTLVERLHSSQGHLPLGQLRIG